MLIDDKLCLGVRLVVSYLQASSDTRNIVEWDRQENMVKATIANASGEHQLNIVGLAIEPDKKCMISLYRESNDNTLGQAIFQYENDLRINKDQTFPLEYEDYVKDAKNDFKDILRRIADKLSIEAPVDIQHQETKEEATRPEYLEAEKKTASACDLRTPSFRRPTDLPGFEDEYQIHEEAKSAHAFRGIEHNYGDNDLYPTGQKYPNLVDPSSHMGPMRPMAGQGGMLFDPLQEQARRKEEEEGKVRGPGWIPGAKFDDPYGHPGFGSNMGPPGSSGFGFGGGGFI